MLRRTVLRAFGGAEEPGGATSQGSPTLRWSLAVDRLFEDLFSALAKALGPSRGRQLCEGASGAPGALSPQESGNVEAGGDPEGGEAEARAPETRLEGPRSRLEGYEFALEGPAGRIRCVNTLRGFLRISGEPRGSRPWEDLVTLQRQGGSYRPVRKRMPDLRVTGSGGGRRVPFRFTSVPELARELREAVVETHYPKT